MTTFSARSPNLNIFHKLVLLLIIVSSAYVFSNPNSQGTWTYVYFSGAANLEFDLEWTIDRDGFEEFITLGDSEKREYTFKKAVGDDRIPYPLPLDIGYLLIIWLAQMIFFLKPIQAVIALQVCFHAISSIWIIGRLGRIKAQLIFFLLYAVNPVVLHFVTLDYHYYWQVLPGLAWIWWVTRDHAPLKIVEAVILIVFFVFCFSIRQSTLPMSLLICGIIFWSNKNILGLALILCFVGVVAVAKNDSQPWHTAYVGIGGYPNDIGVELSDRSGFEHFERVTGLEVKTSPVSGNWADKNFQRLYQGVMREQFFEYAVTQPEQVLRNALLNISQGFSVGYRTDSLILAYLSSLIGFLVAIALIILKMRTTFFLLLSGVSGFALFYPSVPAYMFGNYVILASTLAMIVCRLRLFKNSKD